MNEEKNKEEILEMLARNEEAVARLYEAYSEKFPKQNNFWTKLMQEEMAHASCIRSLCAHSDNCVYTNVGRISRELIEKSIRFLHDKADEVKNINLTLKDALSLALEIETDMIERNYFKIFDTDSKELKDTLSELALATQEHSNRIRDLLTKN